MRPRLIFLIVLVIASTLATTTPAQFYFAADTIVALKIDSFKVARWPTIHGGFYNSTSSMAKGTSLLPIYQL